jgi:hypothetical protein
MRFQPCIYKKDDRLELTPRKIALTAKRLERKRDKVALLPDLAAAVPTVDQELARHAASVPTHAADERRRRAVQWRQARRQLEAMPEQPRRGILRYWAEWSGPLDPVYLLGFIDHATRFGVSYWTTLRELRQLKLIGERRFPQDRVAAVFANTRNKPYRFERDAAFFLKRRAARTARKEGKPSPVPTLGRQMMLGE